MISEVFCVNNEHRKRKKRSKGHHNAEVRGIQTLELEPSSRNSTPSLTIHAGDASGLPFPWL